MNDREIVKMNYFRRPRYLKREVEVEITEQPLKFFEKLEPKIVGFDPKIPLFRRLPDLITLAYSTGYDGSDYEIKIKVGNIGFVPSPEGVLVYCNAISDVFHPGVNEIRIQKRYSLPMLMPSDDDERTIKFSLQDMHAKEVNRFHLMIDPKGQVMELDETNNEERWDW